MEEGGGKNDETSGLGEEGERTGKLNFVESCAISSLIFLIKIGLSRSRAHLNRHSISSDSRTRISHSKLTVTTPQSRMRTLSSKKTSKVKVKNMCVHIFYFENSQIFVFKGQSCVSKYPFCGKFYWKLQFTLHILDFQLNFLRKGRFV